MTQLNGRPENYVRILQSQYDADMSAAEERGRASASQAVQPTPVTTPVSGPAAAALTKEQEADMAQLKVWQREAAKAEEEKDDPKVIAAKLTAHIAEQKKAGRRIGYAQAAQEVHAGK